MDQLLAALNETRERRQVLQDFAADPAVCTACSRVHSQDVIMLGQAFSLMWMASQSADQDTIAQGPSVQHAARRTEFYDDDWVQVWLLIP
jgi:acetoin utilization deacetylase AcuC-like enzyme